MSCGYIFLTAILALLAGGGTYAMLLKDDMNEDIAGILALIVIILILCLAWCISRLGNAPQRGNSSPPPPPPPGGGGGGDPGWDSYFDDPPPPDWRAAAPVCSASRNNLITGADYHRIVEGFWEIPPDWSVTCPEHEQEEAPQVWPKPEPGIWEPYWPVKEPTRREQ